MLPLSSSDEAKLLKQLDLGGVKEDFYQDYLTELSNLIIERYRKEINAKTKGSGTLAQSVVTKPTRNGFEIQADEYFKFVDEGVNGAPRIQGGKYIRPIVTGSRFSFKHLGVGKMMEKSIAQYTGKPLGTAYGIAVSIKKHGIVPRNINDEVLDDKFLELISEDLSTVLGLAVEITFDKALNK